MSILVAHTAPDQPSHEEFSLETASIDSNQILHHVIMGEKLNIIIGDEAAAHKAKYPGNIPPKVLAAIKNKKIRVDFIVASGETCMPQFIGGVIRLPTVITEWNGNECKHYPGEYIEDFCLSTKLLKQFMETNPHGRFPADMGLGTRFMHEIIKSFSTEPKNGEPERVISRGFVAEYGVGNTGIVRVLHHFGATLGAANSSAVLEFDSPTQEINQHSTVAVKTEALKFDGADEENLSQVFLTSWSSTDGKQKIVASFTEAISTFTGDPIVRVQLSSNGNLPDAEELKSIVASLISAGNEEILKREWAVIGDNGSRQAILPTLRVHVLDRNHEEAESKLAQTVSELGGINRVLGKTPMLPLLTNVENIPANAVNFQPLQAKELVTVEVEEKHGQRSSPIHAAALLRAAI